MRGRRCRPQQCGRATTTPRCRRIRRFAAGTRRRRSRPVRRRSRRWWGYPRLRQADGRTSRTRRRGWSPARRRRTRARVRRRLRRSRRAHRAGRVYGSNGASSFVGTSPAARGRRLYATTRQPSGVRRQYARYLPGERVAFRRRDGDEAEREALRAVARTPAHVGYQLARLPDSGASAARVASGPAPSDRARASRTRRRRARPRGVGKRLGRRRLRPRAVGGNQLVRGRGRGAGRGIDSRKAPRPAAQPLPGNARPCASCLPFVRAGRALRRQAMGATLRAAIRIVPRRAAPGSRNRDPR